MHPGFRSDIFSSKVQNSGVGMWHEREGAAESFQQTLGFFTLSPEDKPKCQTSYLSLQCLNSPLCAP